MKTALLLSLCFLSIMLLTGSSTADTLTVSGTVTFTSDTSFTYVRVLNGGILVVDDSLTVLGDMVIESGGKVTHSSRFLAGLRLNVTGTLEVQTGGTINVTGMGLKGGGNGSIFGSHGETFDANDNIISSNNGIDRGSGGSYGGKGGNSTASFASEVYGFIEEARHLGSGGGQTPLASSQVGGNGGGRVTIIAGALIVNGIIEANGAAGSCCYGNAAGGGGSGGSIRCDVSALTGTGYIRANGGNAGNALYQGSGGGGRIAIYSSSNTIPTTNISAYGGDANATGSAGTIYLKDNAQTYGDVIIDNGNIATSARTRLLTSLNAFRNIILHQQGNIQLKRSDIDTLQVAEQIYASANATLWMDSAVTVTITNSVGIDLNIESNANMYCYSGSSLNADRVRINGGVLHTQFNLSYPDIADFELSGGGTLNILNNSVFSIGEFTPTNIQSGTVNITSGSRLDITANSAIIGSGVTLIKDGAFGVGDSINFLTINAGGVITHSNRLLAGLRLKVNDTLEVKVGGAINGTSKGLYGGGNGSIFGSHGETFDASDNIISSNNGVDRGSGGSYGGKGGNSTASFASEAYGFIEEARHLGSGGGQTPLASSQVGGNGGGRVTIIAGALIVNGIIEANGAAGSCCYGNAAGGGGSGGSIRCDVSALTGTGYIRANGGNAGNALYQGSGGGGRIAIYYNTNTIPTTNISAYGGDANATGSAGTIYLKDNSQTYGDVIIDNENIATSARTRLLTSLNTFRNIMLHQQGNIQLNRADIDTLQVEEQIYASTNATMWVDSGATIIVSGNTGFDINVESGANMHLNSGCIVNANSLRINNGILHSQINLSYPNATELEISSGGIINILLNSVFSVGEFSPTNIQSGTVNLTSGSRLDIASDSATIGSGVTLVKDGTFGATDSINALMVLSGGIVTHSNRLFSGLRLNVKNVLEVKPGGAIDVSGKGLYGGYSSTGWYGETYGEDSTIVNGSSINSGASYGGWGILWPTYTSNAPYGLLENPKQLGSGGGGHSYWHTSGGNGGGRITIIAGVCLIDGALRANGASVPSNGGGGSGGSILITAENLMGNGTIEANGGNGICGGTGCWGSGGGGRIAIYYDAMTIPVENVSTQGGTNGNAAASGTVYLKNNALLVGDIIIDNQNNLSSMNAPLYTNLSRFNALIVRRNGALNIEREIEIEGEIMVTSGGRIERK